MKIRNTINKMKKTYIQPQTKFAVVESETLLKASVLDETKDENSIVVTEEEYNGEFSAPHVNVWDE